MKIDTAPSLTPHQYCLYMAHMIKMGPILGKVSQCCHAGHRRQVCVLAELRKPKIFLFDQNLQLTTNNLPRKMGNTVVFISEIIIVTHFLFNNPAS